MYIQSVFLGLIVSFYSFVAIAGSGHDHDHGHSHEHAPVNQSAASTNATNVVADLVKREKLAKSWNSVTASSAEKKVFNGKSEWVVVFENKKITDKEKQKLYLFLTMSGDYIAANYTGK